ncbi:hypothetical protein ACRYCC_10425 [Actinomadura scrupuli]|uniref:hypothetical protein n=1 Tax=Actinomadura scrupuli TaxID=559629 RepID=UPI003D977C5E
MILALSTIAAVFLGGITLGVFVTVVLGIHAEERRMTEADAALTRTGQASRRLLSVHVRNDAEREETGR